MSRCSSSRAFLARERIETKYGTCRVTHSEATANTEPFDGKVVCSNS